ncbi:MAG: phage holin family protein [Acidaminococcales bacterium]|jgi:toxin secretion/phage lysis holin|nr:phage holin family protein [Acidaminococcales bacterium]
MTLQEFFTTLKGAAGTLLPQSRPEQAAMGIGASVGAALSFLFGGLDNALHALAILMTLDYITGIAAAGKAGELNSGAGRRGIGHKAAILGVVSFCNLVDCGMGTHVLRSMAICAYSANEAISILENVDKLGYGQYIPEFIQRRIRHIKEQRTGGGASD